MQVGDLVRRLPDLSMATFDRRPSGAVVTWCGIITKNEKQSTIDNRTPMYWVEWTSGHQGWYYADELEVIDESR